MRNLNVITLIALFITMDKSFANYQWVETPFWKAPQATSIEVKLKSNPQLVQDCEHFKKIMTKDGAPSWITKYSEKVARFRKPLDPVFVTIDVDLYSRIEKEIDLKGFVKVADDKLPYFTQSRAVTGVILEDASNVELVLKPNSYGQISRDLKLKDSEVLIMKDDTGQLVVNFKGLDTACDILGGNAELKMKAPSYIYLFSEEALSIIKFYNHKLIPELEEVINSKNEVIPQKAARVGYRTGKILDEEFSRSKTQNNDEKLKEIVRILFNTKTMEVLPNVIESNGKLYLNLGTDLETKPLTVHLGF